MATTRQRSVGLRSFYSGTACHRRWISVVPRANPSFDPEQGSIIRKYRRIPTLFLALFLVGCGGNEGPVAPTPEALSSFERAVIEEVVADGVADLFWVASGTSGGMFPHLAYGYGLLGVGAGTLAAVTVDPSFEPGLFDPYCSRFTVEGVRQCARIRLRENGEYEVHVYYVSPSDSVPRLRPALAFAGENPVATVRYRPQPLRVWTFEVTSESEVMGASAPIDERLTLTSTEDTSIELEVRGSLVASLEGSREVRLGLTVGGIAACSEIHVAFEDDEEHEVNGGTAGEIRCGDRLWAELTVGSGTPVAVTWVE